MFHFFLLRWKKKTNKLNIYICLSQQTDLLRYCDKIIFNENEKLNWGGKKRPKIISSVRYVKNKNKNMIHFRLFWPQWRNIYTQRNRQRRERERERQGLKYQFHSIWFEYVVVRVEKIFVQFPKQFSHWMHTPQKKKKKVKNLSEVHFNERKCSIIFH